MAETQFIVRWPDQTRSSCYCPSHVVKKYLEAGQHYAMADFVRRSREALTVASGRVKATFGFHCGRAAGTIDVIERRAAQFPNDDAQVTIEAFEDL